MAHSAVQDALLDDDLTPDVEAHLEQCSACADFAGRLETVRKQAVTARQVLAPPPPDRLADRIIERVRTETTTPSLTRERRRRSWLDDTVRRSLMRSAAVAAVVLLVTGVLAVLADQDGGDQRHDVLLASAERTEAAGTAEVTVEGHTELAVPVERDERENGARPGSPEFESFPPEVRQYMEQQWARIMADFERQLAAFEAQVDETIRRGQEQIDRALREAFENFGQGAPRTPQDTTPERPRRPGRPTPQDRGTPPAPPDRLSLRVDLTAGGQVDFRGRAHLEGSLRPTVPSAGVEGTPTGFAVSVDGADAAVRGGNGSWARVEADAGPLGSVLLDPGAVGRILRGAKGDVEVVGEGEVGGAPVRRYRFDVDADALVRAELADQEWEAEAAVDAEGRVRTLRLRSRGGVRSDDRLTWHTDVTLHLRNFGTALGARAAGAADAGATVAPAAQSSVLVHPFGPSVAASLQSASSKSR